MTWRQRSGVVVVATMAAVALGGGCHRSEQAASRPSGAARPAGGLRVVAEFPDRQVTGVAVSRGGRMFVNFPRWDSNKGPPGVAEVMRDGSTRPYPSAELNGWQPGDAAGARDRFVCVQSVYVDDRDDLWIVDPAAPNMEKPVPGGPKLMRVDLASNRVVQSIHFDPSITPGKSYLNDVRVDAARETAYLTDSGEGAIVVVDLATGQARRLLDDHPSTKAEEIQLVVEGNALKDQKTGQPPRINADGIALTRDGETLYYHALTGRTLYRVPTSILRDASAPKERVAQAVLRVGETVAPDGMWIDRRGRVLHTGLEGDAIVAYDPGTGRTETLLQDSRLKWPDTFAEGADGTIYVTTSQIHLTPRFNDGQDKRTQPHRVLALRGR